MIKYKNKQREMLLEIKQKSEENKKMRLKTVYRMEE